MVPKFPDFERNKRRGGENREVFRPAFSEPQPDTFDEEQRRVDACRRADDDEAARRYAGDLVHPMLQDVAAVLDRQVIHPGGHVVEERCVQEAEDDAGEDQQSGCFAEFVDGDDAQCAGIRARGQNSSSSAAQR